MLIQSKIKKGVALERIDPDAAYARRGKLDLRFRNSWLWHTWLSELSIQRRFIGGATGIEPPVWIEESGSYTVSYLLDRPGYSCRAFVFNTSGLRVADISNHELLGISGKITWSGVAQQRKSVANRCLYLLC